MTPTTIAGLILIGYLLLFAEVLVPGGILGIAGVGLIVAAVVAAAFEYGSSVAVPLGLACSFGGVVLFLLWMRYFPSSRMGARFNLRTEVAKEDGYVSQDPSLEDLVGKEGVTLTELRPSGNARIDGRRVDVISDGGFISKGKPVVVTEVSSNRIVVRLSEKDSSSSES